MALRHLDLHYDSADSENSALGLIYKLLPEWERSEGKVEFIRFTDGITNTVCLRQAFLSTTQIYETDSHGQVAQSSEEAARMQPSTD